MTNIGEILTRVYGWMDRGMSWKAALDFVAEAYELPREEKAGLYRYLRQIDGVMERRVV